MKQEDPLFFESQLRAALKADSVDMQSGDWAAMEQLLDQNEPGSLAPIDGSVPPGPGLPSRWSALFIAGLVCGMLSLWAFSSSDTTPMASPLLPVQQQEVQNKKQPLASTNNMEDHPSNSQTSKPHSPNPLSRTPNSIPHTLNPKPATPNPPSQIPTSGESSEILAVTASESTSEPASLSARTTDIRFQDLPEEAYNKGLMAISKLKRKIALLTMEEDPLENSLPDPMGPPKQPLLFGMFGGLQMALDPYESQVAFQPHLGVYVRKTLANRWYVQSGLGFKWLPQTRYYEPTSTLFDPSSTPITDSIIKTPGLLALEVPLLVGKHWQRWRFFGGGQLSMAFPMPVQELFGAQEVKLSTLPTAHEALVQVSRKPAIALSTGIGYSLHSRFGLEMRFNYGLTPLVKGSGDGQYPAIRPTDLMLSATWAW